MDGIVLFIIISLSIFLLISIYFSLSLIIKNKNISNDVRQLELDQLVLYGKIAELLEEKNNQAVEQTDGFLKFVSDSRDWAFGYIDNVQEAISEVALARHKGGVELELAIDKLINLLPEEK